MRVCYTILCQSWANTTVMHTKNNTNSLGEKSKVDFDMQGAAWHDGVADKATDLCLQYNV